MTYNLLYVHNPSIEILDNKQHMPHTSQCNLTAVESLWVMHSRVCVVVEELPLAGLTARRSSFQRSVPSTAPPSSPSQIPASSSASAPG